MNIFNIIRKQIIRKIGNYRIDLDDKIWASMHKKYGKTNKDTKNYLNNFEMDVYSQNGEDGVLLKIIEKANIQNKYFVEFGAWDGEKFSNTCNLRKNYGWEGVLFESRWSRVRDANNAGINCIYLEKIDPFNINSKFEKYGVPVEFGLLSIDIDSDDYWVWEALNNFKPIIVIIETHPGIINDYPISSVYGKSGCYKSEINKGYYGANLNAMCMLARKKGYEFVTTVHYNAVFIKQDYFHLLELPQLDTIEIINKYFQLSEYWFTHRDRKNRKWVRLDTLE